MNSSFHHTSRELSGTLDDFAGGHAESWHQPPSLDRIFFDLLGQGFDFANDKATLGKDAVLKHVSALNPLLDKMAQGASVKLVLVTSNPDQASYLQRLIGNHDRVRVVWRRFALFNTELALSYAGESAADGSRVGESKKREWNWYSELIEREI